MRLTDQPTIPAQVMARRVGDETVILDLGGGNYYGLDRVGSRVWQLIAEGKTLGEACDILQHEFDVAPETLERDVLELAENLLAQKLLAVA